MTQTWNDGLKSRLGKRLKEKEPLASHTSLKVGGAAELFFVVEDQDELVEVLACLKSVRKSYFVFGNGSNLLVGDMGLKGAVIRLGKGFQWSRWPEQDSKAASVEVGAATLLPKLAREAVKKGYCGLEFAEGIPGTVSGAVFMNAGAYGAEMARVVERVRVMDSDGETMDITNQELLFRYRGCSLPPGVVITSVVLQLGIGGPEEKRWMKEISKRRKLSQPAGSPNAGCIFQNPAGDCAGRLVDQCGLKGRRHGQAQVSLKHGNFIVNLGGASSQDVRLLMEEVRNGVRNQTGVELEPEILLVGEW